MKVVKNVHMQLLEKRWPAKEQEDVLREHLTSVFHLAGVEGEHITTWLSHAQEVFRKCETNARVDFPTEARA